MTCQQGSETVRQTNKDSVIPVELRPLSNTGPQAHGKLFPLSILHTLKSPAEPHRGPTAVQGHVSDIFEVVHVLFTRDQLWLGSLETVSRLM